MDDKTPNNDNTPHTDPASADRAPESTPDSPTVPFTPTDAPAPAAPAGTAPAGAAPQPEASAAYPAASSEAPKRGRKRALLIGGGIAAAVLLAGGGVAVGAAMADEFGDDHDDRPSAADGPRHEQGDHDDRGEGQPPQGGPQQGGPGQGGPQRGGPVAGIGTDSADELVDIADAARGAADGDVTSIDAKRDGSWEVTLETAAGDESEVRVDADLATTVVSTETADDGDTGPTATLDEEAIRALVAAALDEAEGMITDLDVDDDASRPYDVSVVTEDRRSIDIDLDASFAVVATDTDD